MTTIANGIDQLRALAGADLGATDWVPVTQERVNLFADATDDHQWIHVDPARAADGPFGGPIAHGYLTLSLLIPLFNELLEVRGVSMSVNYGLDKVRFPSPVKVGAKIRLVGRVERVDDVSGGVQMNRRVRQLTEAGLRRSGPIPALRLGPSRRTLSPAAAKKWRWRPSRRARRALSSANSLGGRQSDALRASGENGG